MRKKKKESLSSGIVDYMMSAAQLGLSPKDTPAEPGMVSMFESHARTRSYLDSDDESSGVAGDLDNIKMGVSPIYGSTGSLSLETVIELCQKAYWNIAIFRSTIDIQSEFCNSKLSFRDKNKSVETFYTNWYKRIGGWRFAQQWFREWFRSGNVFPYRFESELNLKDIRRSSRAAVGDSPSKKIPIRYIILNPADMRYMGSSLFTSPSYGKVLNTYEVSRLRSPQTKEEEIFFNSLPPETQKSIKNGDLSPIMPLDSGRLRAVFCGKQDYEPLAVPMYYPVLTDINLKLEFKKAEQVIARTVDYALLLITAGEKDRPGEGNSLLVKYLTELFAHESVGRVLVSDYTTKAEFVIPDLNKIFGSEKYKVVNEDIANGLMNVFWGEEKFANSMVKISVFLERLNQAREAFLNEFLIPEMEYIRQTLGFTSIPEASFKKIDMKDELELKKLFVRLNELGVLTPEEVFQAFDDMKLPLPSDSIKSQEEFKKHRDNDLYIPVMAGLKADAKTTDSGGRPTGTKAPKTSNKVGPIGASKTYSIEKVKDSVSDIVELRNKIEAKFREVNSFQRLSKKQKAICEVMLESVVSNETPENWNKTYAEYVENPFLDKFTEQKQKIMDLSDEKQIPILHAAFLFHSGEKEMV